MSNGYFLIRIFHTLWPMLPVQWFYLVYYRLLRKRVPRFQVPNMIGTRALSLQEFPPLPQQRVQGKAFTFLNVPAPWAYDEIDWAATDQKKLWRYNLHYFEWLREGEPHEGVWRSLMHDWIARVPYGTGDGWEPYPLSLRIVNWIKWLAQHPEQASDSIKASLYQQCYALERQIEHHIQANHLYKNAVALVFAGCYFNDACAQRWLARGQQLWLGETRRQFLLDGGHFERSPLYHSLCLEDLLDVIQLYRSRQMEIPDPYISKIALRALHWLWEMRDPQGDIMLLNDSAWEIAPTPAALIEYAARLGLIQEKPVVSGVTSLQQSGYFIYRDQDFQLVFDASDIGPAFQPGHTHCDMLSFILWYRGQPIFIDSGVGSYLDDVERRYARSTQAHNTLSIDYQEQSDIWSAFRVGARARIKSASLNRSGDEVIFYGAHDGYSRYWKGVVHSRTLLLKGHHLRIVDTIDGRSNRSHEISIYFHLSHHHRVVIQENYCVVSQADESIVARLRVPNGMTAALVEQPFFPEFGKKLTHPVIVLSGAASLPFKVETLIQFI